MEAKTIIKHLNRLLLDPNNYRFIDRPEYKPVSDEHIAEPRIQQRTAEFLKGRNNENISDLIDSFKTNGVLRQDPIQVRPLGDNYVVIEGNRRTATLKYLYEQFLQGMDVGVLTESDFKSVELIELQGQDRRHELIAMGLNHISGKKRWSPVNQTRLIRDLLEECNMTEDEICSALGITKHYLRRSMRTLSLIERYKNSDYGDQFQTDRYSIFEEIIKNTALKNWLGWNDDLRAPSRLDREERLFSWISVTEHVQRDEETGYEQISKLEPIVTKSHEIRELAKFIEDEKALIQMEESRSVTIGFASSEAVGEMRLHNAIDNIDSEVNAVLRFNDYLSNDDYTRIGRLKTKLERLLPSSKEIRISSLNSSVAPRFLQVSKHYSSLNIRRYRKVSELNIGKLRQLNLFVGENNSGKTTLLEAVYLLAQLNDLNAFLNLERFRGKFFRDFNALWVDRNFISDIDIAGHFNGLETQVRISKEETQENIDRTAYISTIRVDANAGNDELSSYVHLYLNREPELYYQKAQKLCRSAFSSPYRYNDSILREAHACAVKNKRIDEITDFIRDHIDSTIEKIELLDIHGENRFFVTSKTHDSSIDLTKYGEGLQRIFEIALLLSYCSDGILCIDEVDSAIHKGLLVHFAEFVQKLASKYNVQLFLSTHSKECVDAFSRTQHGDMMAFALQTTQDDAVDFRYMEGEKLNELINIIDLDIR